MKEFYMWILLISSFLLPAYYVTAAGLSSPCAMMYLGNLKIGQTYSLQQLLGYPFNVTYKGRSMVDLEINTAMPTKVLDGFEPIPDLNWIKVQRSAFSLDPGQTAETDILVTIPNDEKYLGKKYFVYITPETSVPKDEGPGLTFQSGLGCKLQLEIADRPATPEEIRQIKKRMLGSELSVLVSPERIFLGEVPVGKKIDISKAYNEVIKIINPTNENTTVKLQSLPILKSGLFPPVGYEETEKPDWLILKKEKFVLKPNSIQEVSFYLNFPENKKGKKYFFAISCLISSKYREIRHIVKVYVDTEKR